MTSSHPDEVPELDLEEGPGGDRITLTIPRALAERGLVLVALHRLAPLVTDPVLGPKALGRLQIVIPGYEKDRRELWEIPEVRRFLSVLNGYLPAWFYLADLRTPTLAMMLGSLCRVKAGGKGQWEFEPEDVLAFIDEQFRGMNAIIDELGMSEDVRRSRSEAVTKYVKAMWVSAAPATARRKKGR